MPHLRRLIAILALATALGASALHPRAVQHLEGEARVGISTPIGGFMGGRSTFSSAIALEGRYNFFGTGWDLGVAFNLSSAERQFGPKLEENTLQQNNRTMSVIAITHYNLNQGGKFNPFAGIGLGASYCDNTGDPIYPMHEWNAAVVPCLGLEFVSHARVTLQLNISRQGFNNISFSFGAVLGGKPKPDKN